MHRYLCVAVLALLTLDSRDADAAIIAAGTDTAPSSNANFTLTIFGTGGFTETVFLESGAFDIVRQQQQGDGNGGGDDFIDTEIVSLSLTGTSTNVGAMIVRIGAGNAVQQGQTLGQITEVRSAIEGTTTVVGPENFISGNSFFDVFFEIDVGGTTFYNKDPHQLVAPNITQLPPIGDTHFPPGSVKLFKRLGAFNDAGDPHVGQVEGDHTITPEPTTLAIWSVLGGIGLAVGHRRRKRKVT